MASSDSFFSDLAEAALNGNEEAFDILFNINPNDPRHFGYQLQDGVSWRCRWPGCDSKSIFTKDCELRKHFRRHRKPYFCSYADCPRSTQGGYSTEKDRVRHESSHNPAVSCEWEGCDQIFSRVDNMRNHVSRKHDQGPAPA